MNINTFNILQKIHGTDVVWNDKDGYHFCMGDMLMDRWCEDDEVTLEHDRLDDECDNIDEVEWSVGRGDEVVNCVSVKELNDFDKVPGLESFVLEYVGHNCYCDE